MRGCGEEGRVEGVVYQSVPERLRHVEVTDYGDKLIIPAMNDMHVHAPQYRNMGLAMDLELLPWLNTYTFPEERKFADPDYARRIYSRFVHELWMQGTMRSVVFGTIHPESTSILAELFRRSGMGAYVGLVGMDRNCPDYLRNTTREVVEGTLLLHRGGGTGTDASAGCICGSLPDFEQQFIIGYGTRSPRWEWYASYRN